ncbi:hypothetical protein FKM82_007226 [Ascaphus truei]
MALKMNPVLAVYMQCVGYHRYGGKRARHAKHARQGNMRECHHAGGDLSTRQSVDTLPAPCGSLTVCWRSADTAIGPRYLRFSSTLVIGTPLSQNYL